MIILSKADQPKMCIYTCFQSYNPTSPTFKLQFFFEITWVEPISNDKSVVDVGDWGRGGGGGGLPSFFKIGNRASGPPAMY